MPPTFLGVRYIGLSVRDLPRSVAWYRDLLDFEVERENYNGSAWPSDWDEVLLRHRGSGLLIGLLAHASNPGEMFSEFRTAWGSETRIRSRGGAVVLVDESTEQVQPANIARVDRDRDRNPGFGQR